MLMLMLMPPPRNSPTAPSGFLACQEPNTTAADLRRSKMQGQPQGPTPQKDQLYLNVRAASTPYSPPLRTARPVPAVSVGSVGGWSGGHGALFREPCARHDTPPPHLAGGA